MYVETKLFYSNFNQRLQNLSIVNDDNIYDYSSSEMELLLDNYLSYSKNEIEKILLFEFAEFGSIKIFFEYQSDLEFQIISDNIISNRLSYIKYGFLDADGDIHYESIAVDESLNLEMIKNNLNKMIYDFNNTELKNKDFERRTYNILFEPRVSASIIHEIFGHPFEKDLITDYTTHNSISFPHSISVDNIEYINSANYSNYVVANKHFLPNITIVKNGRVVGEIDSLRQSRYDGLTQTRMNYLKLHCEPMNIANIEIDFVVKEIQGACVNVLDNNIYLISKYLYTNNRKILINNKVLKICLTELSDNFKIIEKGANIFQQYCVKNNSPISVFSSGPKILMLNVKIVDGNEVYDV